MVLKRRIIYIATIALILGVLFAAGRTSYVSDYLMTLAAPELELITGKKVILGRIQVNFLPLFIELNDTVFTDIDGRKLLSAGRVKAYLSLSGLLNREIVIKRIAIDSLDAHMEDKQISDIAGNIKKYLAIERKDAYKIFVRSVLLNKSLFDLQDGRNKVLIKAGAGELLLADKSVFNLILRDFTIAVNGMPETPFSAESTFSVNNDTVAIRNLKLKADGSELIVSGGAKSNPPSGDFSAEADILVNSVKSFFGLEKKGEGRISITGSLKIGDIKTPEDIFIDLKVKGNLYLETLMELLKVDERLEGAVTAEGEIRGPLNNLLGSATATLKNGNLFGVVVDSLTSKVNYGDRKMKFSEAEARLYGGTAKAEAMIVLPVVNYYTFKVDAKGVNSKGIFELINWDPGIANGKVDGQISSQGSYFNPRGIFSYRKAAGGKDVLERVNSIEGSFSMTDDVITFPEMHIHTGRSSVLAAGLVDLKKKNLNLKAGGSSSDIYDLADPYFRAINGPATFTATVSGSTLDPVLDVKFSSGDIKYLSGDMDLADIMKPYTVSFSSVEGDLHYTKNMLGVNNFIAVSRGMKIRTKGRIGFKKAKRLFDLISPEYDLQINFENGDLYDLSSIIRGAPAIKGSFQSSFALTGVGQKAVPSGTFSASDINISDTYSLDKADAVMSFEKGEFNFKSLILRKGVGVMTAKGMISMDKRYSIAAKLNTLELRDAIPASWREKMGERNLKTLSLTDVSVQGRGTIANPVFDIKGLLRYRDPQREQSSGYGKVSIGINGKDVALSGNFMQGKVTISGSATLDDKLPWRADMAFQSARSDFLVALFLTDIPEDLLVNLKGDVKLWGESKSINAIIAFDKAYLYGYGYGFTNSRPISIKLQDKLLSIDSFAMKNELAELRISGSATLGKSYNLVMDGGSSLAPLRAMSRNLDLLKGDASFALSLTGDWDKPRINGRINVVNGALGLKNMSHRLTSLNARIVADGDRIVLEDAKGTLAGGDIVMTGAAYLDQFKLRRFFLDAKYNNVTIAVSKNFWVHSDGKLTYQGTLNSQNISGDVNISKARYTERVDWKSWLIQTRKNEVLKIDRDQNDQTGLNVRVIATNLSIDNNVLRAALKMDILLKGTIGQPALLGRVESVNGIIYFRNNELKLLKGVIDFAKPGEIKPFFDIIAETRIKNYTVRLALDGYIDQFNLALSSTPTLEEADILSLMAAGDLSKNLKGSSGGIGAGEATSFLTGKLQDVVEDRLKTVIGLDRLQIDPSVSKTTGAVSPRLTISKKLIGDRFYATYSTAADVGEGQIIKLEYLLNKNISLLGVRDEIGGVGADIKFRFQFK